MITITCLKHQIKKYNVFLMRFFQSDLFDEHYANNISKKCIDCKNYKINTTTDGFNNVRYDWANAKCLHYKIEFEDPKGDTYLDAYITRSEKTLCGPTGRYYMAIPTPKNKNK